MSTFLVICQGTYLWSIYTGKMQPIRTIGTAFSMILLTSSIGGALWGLADWSRETTRWKNIKSGERALKSGEHDEPAGLLTHVVVGGVIGLLAPIVYLRDTFTWCQIALFLTFLPKGRVAQGIRVYYPHKQPEMINAWNGKRWVTLTPGYKSRWGFKAFDHFNAHPEIIKQLNAQDKVD